MRWLRAVLVGVIFALGALRWPERLAAGGFVPVWLLLPGLCLGLTATPGRAAFGGFLYGLLADLLSLEPLGVHAFAFGGAALVVSRLRDIFFCEHPLTQAFLGFAFAVLTQAGLLARLWVAEPSFHPLSRLPATLLASLATAALLPLFAAADERVGIFRGFRARDVRV